MSYNRNYVDPSFALGMALGNAYGNMWASNAKQRQEKKLDDYINEQRNADFMAELEAVQPATTDRRMEEAQQALNLPYNIANSGSVDRALGKLEYKIGKDKPNVLGNIRGLNGVDNAINAIADADAQGAINFMQKQEGMSQGDRARQQYRNLTVDKVANWARANGINKEVFDARMPSLQRELSTEVGLGMLPEIYANLYSGNTDGIIAGMEQIEQLAQYDPERAERLRNYGDRAMATNFEFAKRMELAKAKQANQSFTGNKGNAQSNSIFRTPTADMNMAIKRIERIETIRDNHLKNDPNYKMPAQVQAEYDALQAFINKGWQDRLGTLPAETVGGEQPATVANAPEQPQTQKSVEEQMNVQGVEEIDPIDNKQFAQALNLLDSGELTEEELLNAIKSDFGTDSKSYLYIVKELQKRSKGVQPANNVPVQPNTAPLVNQNTTPVTDEEIIAVLRGKQ